ncbi:MAG TPA: zinc ribbon domain-containing protein [Thermoplasmata archaeon]|nr:zinc ribbon domain-containing protein [Thermoplasmata archaeon]
MTAGIPSYCSTCGAPLASGARFCSACGAQAGGPLPMAPTGVPPSLAWDPRATEGPRERPVSREVDRTRTGFTLMVIGFLLAWIPYANYVGGLLLLAGVVLLWLGRRGFGEAHHRAVLAGGLLFAGGIAVGLVGSLWLIETILTANLASIDPTAFAATLQTDLEAILVLAAISGAMGALGYLLVPFELSDGATRTLLAVAFVASVAVNVYIESVLWQQLAPAIAQATSGTTVSVGPIQALEFRLTLYGLLNAIPNLLFAYAYYRTRRRVIEGPMAGSPPPGAALPFGRTG